MRRVEKRELTPSERHAYNEEGLDREGYGARPIWQPQFGETRRQYVLAWIRWKRDTYDRPLSPLALWLHRHFAR